MPEAESPESRDRFWWLWRNRFYETTDLTGYSFINDSKRKLEALFWYGTIIALTIFTLHNVKNMVDHYRSKPTKTEVLITSNALDATIGNFTFKLKLPIAEIQSTCPLAIWPFINMPLSCTGTDLFQNMENAHHCPSQCLPMYLIPLIETYNNNPEYVEGLTNFGRDSCEIPEDPLNKSYTSIVETEKVILNLSSRLSETLEDIWSKMAWHEGGTDSGYTKNLFNAALDFNAAMQGNLERNYFTTYLLLKIMSDETLDKDIPFVQLFNATEFFQHSTLSLKETLEEISIRLLDIAPFVLPEQLYDTQFFIRDWDVEYINERIPVTKDETSSYRKFGNSFTLEFQVRPTDGAQEFAMNIKPPKQLIKLLFPLMHMDSWLAENWENPFVYHLTACEINDWAGDIDLSMTEKKSEWLANYFGEQPRSKSLEKFVYPAIEFYKRHSELKLDTGIGQLTLKPFYKYRINQLPMGRMVSKTDDCASIKLDDCLNLCQRNYTLEKCQCYPWNLHYLHAQSDIAICSKPCPGLIEAKDACFSKCEEVLAHPCDHIIYRTEISDQTPINNLEKYVYSYRDIAKGKLIDEDFNLFSFKITIERVMTYVKTLESYETTFTNLLSEFGGFVDFWLGVNLIGIIHAFVYFLKQCCHCNREHKTGRTIRRLVTCTSENTDVWPNEEQSAVEVHRRSIAKMQQQINRRFIEMDRKLKKIMKEHLKLNNRIKRLEH